MIEHDIEVLSEYVDNRYTDFGKDFKIWILPFLDKWMNPEVAFGLEVFKRNIELLSKYSIDSQFKIKSSLDLPFLTLMEDEAKEFDRTITLYNKDLKFETLRDLTVNPLIITKKITYCRENNIPYCNENNVVDPRIVHYFEGLMNFTEYGVDNEIINEFEKVDSYDEEFSNQNGRR